MIKNLNNFFVNFNNLIKKIINKIKCLFPKNTNIVFHQSTK